MKNIAIFGSARAGKSTLSKMIAKKFPNYHVISGDDIKNTFKEILPQNNINSKGGSGMKEDFPNFLSTYFYKSIKRNDGVFNYIVETCDITPQKAKELFDKENTILLFIGVPDLTIQEHFNEIRKYENEYDWTFGRSDESILEHCKYWVSMSKKYEKECEKLGIWYVNTSFNRDKVLKETLSKIEKKI